ncbi:MAG: C39 family peptidase [Nitrospiraceae bacterium]|nr:C39 family peptidase [Nitrospiraceae bacterium]
MKMQKLFQKQEQLKAAPAFFLVFLVFLFNSCSSISSLPEPKQSRVINNIPFYSQEEYQCGPASLAGLMNFLGVEITPEEIAKEIYSKSAKGTLNIDMIFYPQTKGLISEQYSGNIEDVKKKIDSGYPLIVFVDYGFLSVQANHFMVIVGYNEHGVIANSGKDKHKTIIYEDFKKIWEKTKNWTLILKRK